LGQILSRSVETFELRLNGNNATKSEFIAKELNVTTPNDIESCSVQIFDGINRLKDELDLLESANAVIDIDGDDASKLICDLTVNEKSRLTATIGASHDMHAMSQLNGSLSVGIRNVFGGGEKVDLAADLGLGTANDSAFKSSSPRLGDSMFDDDDNGSNQSANVSSSTAQNRSIYNIVHNTSNQYSITFSKPRVDMSWLSPIFGEDDIDKMRRSQLMVKAFQQKLDRTRSSSYCEDSLGTTSSMMSWNGEHSVSYHYHLRSLIPTVAGNVNGGGVGMDAISSPSVADESTIMSTKSSVSYRFVRDRRDHPSVPTKGYMVSAEVECAGLGGDADFVKAMASWHGHWSLPEIGGVLNFGVQSGFVMPWKRAMHRMMGKENGSGDRHIRIIDRIIPLGGLQLRGFEHAQIGPRDRNDYVHCDLLCSFGVSLCVPIQQWLYGNVFANISHCELMNNVHSIRDIIDRRIASVGVSGIIPFPVGRLEIGYAHPLWTRNNPFSPFFWAFDVQFF